MNAGELIGEFRRQTDDAEADPSLWGDEELMLSLNEAEVEACRRARLLVDTQNKTAPNNVCRLTLVIGTEFYAVDPRVIYIRRALLVGRSLPLEPLDYRSLDYCQPGWQTRTGNVTGYVRGLDTGKFRPYRIPTAVGSIDLLVVRQPLTPMAVPNDAPEINSRYHMSLLDWVYFRAYSKQDTETYDPNTAAKHLAMFEAEFGTREKASALEEEWMRNMAPLDEAGNF